MQPYRPLFELGAPSEDVHAPPDLTIGGVALIAVSAIQLASGAQLAVGVLGLAGGVAALFKNWRSSWTTSSSSC